MNKFVSFSCLSFILCYFYTIFMFLMHDCFFVVLHLVRLGSLYIIVVVSSGFHFIFPILTKAIGWEECLLNDLFCFE